MKHIFLRLFVCIFLLHFVAPLRAQLYVSIVPANGAYVNYSLCSGYTILLIGKPSPAFSPPLNYYWSASPGTTWESNATGDSTFFHFSSPGQKKIILNVKNVQGNQQAAVDHSVSVPASAFEGDHLDYLTLCNVGTCRAKLLMTLPPACVVNWGGQILPYYSTSYVYSPLLCPGVYPFSVTDSFGCTVKDTARIFAYDLPMDKRLSSDNPLPCNDPDSLGNPGYRQKVCPGQIVKYWVDTLPYWDQSCSMHALGTQTGEVLALNAKNVTVTWGGAGTSGIIEATGYGFCGSVWDVSVIDSTHARYSTIPASDNTGTVTVCGAQAVNFQSQSLKSDRVEWDFGDFTNKSASTNPSHHYAAPGDYLVRLISVSPCGCFSDTVYQKVHVQPGTSPSLECLGTVCLGAEVTYTASPPCTSYQWSISGEGAVVSGGGPADASVAVHWTNGELGHIGLLAGDCQPAVCPLPARFDIPLLSDAARISGDTTVCGQQESEYTLPSFNATQFSWSISPGGQLIDGQGTNRVRVLWTGVDSANAYLQRWVAVQYDNCFLGCGGTDTLPVRQLPKYRISGPPEICRGTKANFSALTITHPSQSIKLNWEVRDAGQNLLWSANNVSNITLPDTLPAGQLHLIGVPANPGLSCLETEEFTFFVRPLPPALTGISGTTEICPGIPYTYDALGATLPNSIFWKTTTSTTTVQGPSAVFTWNTAASNILTAWQTSIDGLGCKSPETKLEIKKITAVPISGPQEACAQTEVTYTAPNYQNLNFQWTILPASAGVVASGQGSHTVKVFWYTPGMHSVQVSACSFTASYSTLVHPRPSPVVEYPAELCTGLTTTVQTIPAFVGYQWRSGENALISTASAPELAAGHYALVVTDNFGCRGDTSFQIEPLPAPTVNISTPDLEYACAGHPVRLYATDTDAGLSYQWQKDGQAIGSDNALLTTIQGGFFQVTATADNGCTAVSNVLKIVGCANWNGPSPPGQITGQPGDPAIPCPPGQPDFAIEVLPPCDQRQYHALLSADYLPGSIVWLFMPDSQMVGQNTNPVYDYAQAGFVKVWMGAGYTNGAYCLTVKPDSVLVAAEFSIRLGCLLDTTFFADQSTRLPVAGIVNWVWDFGDPASGNANTAFGKNPGHRYDLPGDYLVTLTVTATSGCTSSQSHLVHVSALPDATIADPVAKCAGNATAFSLTNPSPDLLSWQWNFGDPASGDGNTAVTSPAYHQYALPGIYPVSVKIKNAYGCENQSVSSVQIGLNTLAGLITINPAGGKICSGDTAWLAAPAGGLQYLWNTGASSAVLAATTASGYFVTLTDAIGCTYSPPPKVLQVQAGPGAQIVAVSLNEDGAVSGIFDSPYEVCAGEDVVLQAHGELTTYEYVWNNGTHSSGLVFTNDHQNLLAAGDHLFEITVTDPATGCSAPALPFTVVVHPTPNNVQIGSQPNGPLCGHQPVILSVLNPDAGNTYDWNTGLPGIVLTTDQAGQYRARATNGFGCVGWSAPIVVRPGAPVEAVPGGCFSRCNGDTVCLPPIPGVASWQWYFEGQALAGATEQAFVPTASGTYFAEITDTAGCTARSALLTLTLSLPYGNISGQVWVDVNLNGLIDGADTTISNIPVQIINNQTIIEFTQSDQSGSFAFPSVLAQNYSIQLGTLPTSWSAIIGQAPAALAGCDSKQEVALLIRSCPPVFSSLELEACAGTSVPYDGQEIMAGQTQIFTFSSITGCDSIVQVTVNAFPQIPPTTVTLSACAGTAVLYNGQEIMAGQIQTFTFPSITGCDSIVQVTINAFPQIPPTTVTLSACAGTAVLYNGQEIMAGQTQTFTFPSITGCDSIVQVTVNAFPQILPTTLDLSACAGTAVLYNGQEIMAGQIQTFTFPSITGCDSLVEVTVQPWPATPPTLITLSACADSSATFNGQEIPAGQSQTFIFSSVHGCDSLVQVLVQSGFPSTGTLNLILCPGDTAFYNDQPVNPGSPQVWHLINAAGCDSLLTVSAEEYPAPEFEVVAQSACAWQNNGSVEVHPSPGSSPPFTFSTDGLNWSNDPLLVGLATGPLQLILRDGHGCLSRQTITIGKAPPLNLDLTDRLLPCDSVQIILQPVISGGSGDLNFVWSTGSHESVLPVFHGGQYSLEVRDACETLRSTVEVTETGTRLEDVLYVPNVFAPDADNENRCFRAFWAEDVVWQFFQLDVYDRWGNHLFHTLDPQECWDGIFRQQAFNPGVLVWVVDAQLEICGHPGQHLRRYGDVTIVR